MPAVESRPSARFSGFSPTGENAKTALADPVFDLLREIRDELRGLRADLARDRRPPSRASLLPAIAGAVQARAFTATELRELADVSPALASAFEAAHITSARQLGKALAALEGRAIGGHRLVRLSEETAGIVWRVFEDREAPNP